MSRPIQIITSLSLGVALLFSSGAAFAQTDDKAISNLFSQNADAVVVVGSLNRSGKNDKVGTGFVITPDGFIVTNYHLIHQAKKVFVKLRNNTGYTRVKVIVADATNDIALLKVAGINLATVKLGDSNEVKVGEQVVTIGNPLGLEETVTDGLISSLRNTDQGVGVLQISVPLSPGSSGGPLFNLKNEVIGVTVASYPRGQNLNFAVPINAVKPLLKRTSYAQYLKRSLGRKLAYKNPSLGGPKGPPLFKEQRRDLGKIDAKTGRPLASESTSPRPKENPAVQTYTVSPGDTLFGIAKRFHASVEELIQLNTLADTKIYAGQKIRVPSSAVAR